MSSRDFDTRYKTMVLNFCLAGFIICFGNFHFYFTPTYLFLNGQVYSMSLYIKSLKYITVFLFSHVTVFEF